MFDVVEFSSGAVVREQSSARRVGDSSGRAGPRTIQCSTCWSGGLASCAQTLWRGCFFQRPKAWLLFEFELVEWSAVGRRGEIWITRISSSTPPAVNGEFDLQRAGHPGGACGTRLLEPCVEVVFIVVVSRS